MARAEPRDAESGAYRRGQNAKPASRTPCSRLPASALALTQARASGRLLLTWPLRSPPPSSPRYHLLRCRPGCCQLYARVRPGEGMPSEGPHEARACAARGLGGAKRHRSVKERGHGEDRRRARHNYASRPVRKGGGNFTAKIAEPGSRKTAMRFIRDWPSVPGEGMPSSGLLLIR